MLEWVVSDLKCRLSTAATFYDQFNLRETCVAHMLKLVIRADKDGDMKIDPEEGEKLMLSIDIQMNVHGVELDIDIDLFRDMLLEDNSVENIVRFCSMVLYPEIALKNEKERNLSDDDDDDFFASEPTRRKSKSPSVKFSDFLRKASTLTDELFEEEMKLTVEEKLGMTSITDKYSQGSVEVARGRKATMLPMAQKSNRITRIQKVTEKSRKRCSEVETRMSKRISVIQMKSKPKFVRSNTSAEF